MPATNVSELRMKLELSSTNLPENGYLELTNPTANLLLENLILLEKKQLKTLVLRPDHSYPSGVGSIASKETTLTREVSIGLYTSGTTGAPKLHFLPFSLLASATKRDHPARAWGLLYSPSRMAGLQVVLQAFASNAKLVEPEPGATLNEVLHEFEEHGVDSISATPSRWRSILGSDHFAGLTLKHISLGGEIADQRILDRLRAKFPQAAIRHIYATTETGPVFSVSDGLEGFPVENLERELASGRRLEIIDGELVVIVPATGQIPNSKSKSIYTGDLVIRQENRILFVGRIGDVVNVGGLKISLSEIEKQCNLLTGVIDSQARAIPSAFMGFLISIDIHWAGDPLSDQEIRGHLRKFLPKAALPALINSVNGLDLSANHKKKRVT